MAYGPDHRGNVRAATMIIGVVSRMFPTPDLAIRMLMLAASLIKHGNHMDLSFAVATREADAYLAELRARSGMITDEVMADYNRLRQDGGKPS